MPRDRDDRRSGGKSKKNDSYTRTLIVGPFRMAFVSLLEPEEDDYGNERYKLTALFPPDYDKKKMKEFEDAIYDVFEHKFGDDPDDWPNGRNDILPDMKLYDAGTKKYAGFEKGWTACSMSSTEQPGLIDADKREVMSKREVYSGRWARAQVTISAYDNKSKGVGVYLNHVQLLDHDEAFTGRGSAEDVFDEYEMKDRRSSRRDEDEDDRDSRNTRDRDGRASSRRRDNDDDGRDREDNRRSRRRDEDDEDRQEGRSRSRGRRNEDEDEDEEKPRGRDRGRGRDRDEDEEEEKPRRGRSRRDEDEEEDRGSRRGRSRSEDDEPPRSSGRRSRSSRDQDDDEAWN